MDAPNLFLIGAQKGGSSSFFTHLASHPDVSHMGRKELNVFNAPDVATARARLAEVAPAFPGRRWLLDASVDYTRYPKFQRTPENIREICGPDVRFVYIIRDPVERMLSNHHWTKQLYGGARDLETAIRIDPQMVETSRYDVQLRRYLAHFDRDRFWVATLEQFSADPAGAMNALYRWLDIPEQGLARPDVRRGATDKGTTRELRLGVFSDILWSQAWLRRMVRSVLPERTVRRLIRTLSVEKARVELTADQKRALMLRHFSDTARETAALTGLDLGAWQAPPN